MQAGLALLSTALGLWAWIDAPDWWLLLGALLVFLGRAVHSARDHAD